MPAVMRATTLKAGGTGLAAVMRLIRDPDT